MEIFLGILVIAMALFLIGKFRSRGSAPASPIGEPPAMRIDEEAPVDRIQTALQDLREALSAELSRVEEDLRTQSGDVHARVAERKRIAKALDIDKKLAEIYDEIRLYPSWKARPDFSEYNLCEIEDPRAEERGDEKILSFALNGRRYKFSYKDKGGSTGFDGEYFHHTTLTLLDESRAELISINISVDVEYLAVSLRPFSIEAFRPGVDWIQDFVTCYEQLQANRRARDLKSKYDPEKVRELKERFGLDE